jgi:hypothetical protein
VHVADILVQLDRSVAVGQLPLTATVRNFGALFDVESLSRSSVCGVVAIFWKKDLCISCVTIVTPTSMNHSEVALRFLLTLHLTAAPLPAKNAFRRSENSIITSLEERK